MFSRQVAAAHVLLCLVWLSASSFADSAEYQRRFIRSQEKFDKAATADEYRAAAEELESISAEGFRSGAVYFNTGNAWFRAGEFGRAIMNYRMALPYRPTDPYLAANLRQARAAAPGRLQEVPVPWWAHVFLWSEWLSFPTKVRLTSLLLLSSAVVVTCSVVLKKPALHWLGICLFCVSCVTGVDTWLTHPDRALRQFAVITRETEARKGTGANYEPAFDQPLCDGAEFTVLSETEGWTLGHFPGAGDGWVRNECLVRAFTGRPLPP